MSILSEAMAPTSGEVVAGTGNSGALAARNHTLLSYRDNALLLAYRISGNIADAEDILQNAYLKAVRMPALQVQSPDLRKWFMQLTASTAKDWLRSSHRRRERERKVAMEQTHVAPAASVDCEHAELKQQLNTEIARLDEKFRAPICLHYEQGMTYEEVAEVLGVPASSLRANACRGMQLLRERLDRPQRPVTAEVLTAVLALGTALTASQTLAASIDQIVTAGPASAAAQAVVAQQTAAGLKVFTPMIAAGQGLLVKALIAAVLFLAASAATLGWLLYNEHRARMELVAAASAAVAETQPAVPDVTQTAALDAPVNQPVLAEPNPLAPVTVQQQTDFITPLPGANAPWRGAVPLIEPGADYVPPPEVEALWANAVDLTAHARLDRDVVAGNWSRREDGLHVSPSQFGRVRLNFVPPEEYDFRIDFTRLGGETEIIQMVPLDGITAAWHIESWGSHYWGPLKDNPHVAPAKHLANGRRHTSVIEVRKDALSAYLDGEMVLRIKREDAPPLDAESYWRLPDQRMLGIGGKATRLTFHRVALREITGKARHLSNDPFEAGFDEKYWADARNLMPATVAQGGVIAGQWVAKPGNVLACTGQFARYQFNYAPPEEYDMRVTFIRTKGQRDVVQILPAGGTQFTWKIGAEQIATLDTISGKTWSKSPVSLRTPDLVINGTPVTSIFCVRKGEVWAYVDGRLMLAMQTDFTNLSIENAWKLRLKDAIGVGSLDNAVQFHRIQVKEISGPGRDLEAGNDAPKGDF